MSPDRLVGVQVGAVSFQDEGVAPVLDTLQARAAANAVFLVTPTWSRATGARAAGADHGRPGPDADDWAGGHSAAMHPEFYRTTALGPAGQAVDGWDMLGAVIPEARRRGMQSYVLMDESAHARALRAIPGFLRCLEADIWNKPARRPCFNNPDYRNWHLGLVEDMMQHYELDGLLWSSERPGPLDRLLSEPTRQGLGLVTCYCEHCKARGRERGVDWRRAQEGYRKLVLWNAAVAAGERPEDGAFVTFWRLLLQYPELLAWQSLWQDGQFQIYRDIFGTVRAVRPEVQVGWNMYQNISFSPFYRAGQAYADLSHICDFLKLSTYDSAAGPRFHTAVAGIARTVFGDADPHTVYPLMLRILGFDEAPYDELPARGFSADYVRREVRRALVGGEGRCVVYAGIDAGVPVGPAQDEPGDIGDRSLVNRDETTGPGLSEPGRARVKAAVLAAFAGGAAGVVLGEKYAAMRLDTLSGAGDAAAELMEFNP